MNRQFKLKKKGNLGHNVWKLLCIEINFSLMKLWRVPKANILINKHIAKRVHSLQTCSNLKALFCQFQNHSTP